ncbi:MFS general substrate transporter [Heliocybe sulcata]|uniref:MFS general substrate transporter n=1 Tax=Heliocybe sulcata TaxID=5364 RepID=A0A5C3MKP0_9AGAM|nr:MFS general substrate transporter [Heliocybe sulcata]
MADAVLTPVKDESIEAPQDVTPIVSGPDGHGDSTGEKGSISFPEGGLTAWLTVLGGSMVLFCTIGAVQSFGVYQDYYTRVSLDEHPPSDVSWIGALQVCLLFTMGLPAGKLFDEGYFHVLLALGSLIYLVSLFMLSLAKPHHYYQNILAQGVGMGIGMGLIFLPSLSIASHYFRRKRSLAIGFVIAGSSIGGVIFPILQNHLFYSSAGFPWGVRAAGFICLFLLGSANLLMKTRLPTRKQRGPNNIQPDVAAIMRDVPYLVCVAGFITVFYLQLYAVLHGVPSNIANYALSILNSAALFGRTLPNFAGDIYGPFNVAIPMTFIAGGLIFALFGATSTGGMVVFALLYGFFSGGFISLIAPIAASFATNLGEVGVRIGILCFFVGFAVLTGNPIAGALLRPPHYSWYRPILFAAIVVLFGSFLLFISRAMVARKKGIQRL